MAAFELLYRAHAPAVLARIIRPRVAGAADQEDLLVETFRAALEGLPAYRWTERGLFAWLARIAKNRIIDQARAAATRARGAERLEGESSAAAPTADDWGVLANAGRAHLRTALEGVLAELNPRYAEALRLRFVEELSRPLCAAALEVRVETFDVLLLRAVRALRAAWLARYGTEEWP